MKNPGTRSDQMREPLAGASIGMLLLSTLFVAAAGTELHAEQAAEQIKRDVERALADERDLRPIEVTVAGNEVTLMGRVPTFWAKSQAIQKTLEVAEVETVVSELEIPAIEDDNDLGQEVVEAVLGYAYYTMFDYISVFVNRGEITLTGSVTPDFDKAAALFERVAKVHGVQDVRTTIEILPVSQMDADLRSAIASRVFNDDLFERHSTRTTPPFHIIVRGSSVTLLGVVRGELEKRRLRSIVRQTFGVVRVVDELQTGQ